jgi:hypothetical protein
MLQRGNQAKPLRIDHHEGHEGREDKERMLRALRGKRIFSLVAAGCREAEFKMCNLRNLWINFFSRFRIFVPS